MYQKLPASDNLVFKTTAAGLVLAGLLLWSGTAIWVTIAHPGSARGRLLLTFARTQWDNGHYPRAIDLSWLALRTMARDRVRYELAALFWERARALKRAGQPAGAQAACRIAARFDDTGHAAPHCQALMPVP